METALQITAVSVLAALLGLLLKKGSPELAMLLTLAAVTGRPPQTALRMALEQVTLGREEENLLLELCGCLGRYDLCGQARALELYKTRLDGMIAESENVIHRRSRAWMTASVCSGLALIVMLL